MQKRIFIASTIFDLIDVRAEVETLLREMELTPILSDSATSDFSVLPDRNSIETCLANVRASDYVVIILSERYGPRLGCAGFENVSATHLEYKEARTHQRPILFYARDRLESDYRIWKKHGRPKSMKLTWVQQEKDFGMFELIDKHQKLAAKSKSSNWYQTFRNSVELKSLLTRDLRLPAAQTSLARAVRENTIPLMQGSVEWKDNSDSTLGMVTFKFTNLGRAPAFNVRVGWADDGEIKRTDTKAIPVVAPNESTQLTVLIGGLAMLPLQREAIVDYQTPEGHFVQDTYLTKIALEVCGDQKILVKRCALKDKLYKAGSQPPFRVKTE